MEKVKPLGGVVLVEVPEVDEMTQGGIILPDTVRSMERKLGDIGVIVSWGPLAWDDYSMPANAGNGPERWGVKKGQKVLFCRQGGRNADDSEPGLRLLNDTDILAAIE